MIRKIEQWRNCDPEFMAGQLGTVAIGFALQAAKSDIIELYALVERVARLNPDAGEIGPGMLASLVEQACRITGEPK